MPSLMLEIGANIARLQSDMAKAERTVDGFARAASNAFKAIGAYLVGGQLIQGLTNMSQAYMEQERAINKMSVAMKNQGDFSQKALDDLSDFASEIQNTTTVADEAALAIMANMKSYGMLNDEVKTATQAAIDFASAKRDEGMTIEQASEIIGKAYMGQTERLKRYGIIVDETKSRAEKFDQVMQQLRERFGGAAAAELDTYEGQLKNVNNQFGEVKESIGQLVLAFGTGFLPTIRNVITELQNAAQGMQLFFDTSRKGQLEKKQMEIIEQLNEVEGKFNEIDQAASPGLFSRIWDGFFGAGTGAERAAAKAADLKSQLVFVREELRKLDVAGAKVEPGGKRFIPPDYEGEKKAKQEREKWLTKYLQDVDKRWDAEVKQNERLGQLAMETQKEQDEALEKRAKAEIEYRDMMGEIQRADLKRTKDEMEQANKSLIEIGRYTAEQMQQNFSDFFFNVMQGKFESLSDFAKATLATIQRAAANYLSQMLTEWAFGMEKMGGGRSGGFLAGLFGSGGAAAGSGALEAAYSTGMYMIHEGGEVGKDSFPIRYAPAGLLNRAPRLHGGLASDEYPAILQKGEQVIPKDQAGDKATNVNILINAVDAASFAQLAARNPQAITGPVMEALQRGGQLRNLIKGVV